MVGHEVTSYKGNPKSAPLSRVVIALDFMSPFNFLFIDFNLIPFPFGKIN
jgi:hypothetical protein